MKRPMCVIGLSFALTTWAAFAFDARRSLFLSAAVALTGLLFLAVDRRALRGFGVACLVAGLAFALHARQEVRLVEPFLRADGDTVQMEGLITDAGRGRRTIYYTVAAKFPDRPDLPGTTVRLRTYGEMDLRAGDGIRCQVLLAPQQPPEAGLRPAPDRLLDGYLKGEAERVDGGHAFRRAMTSLRERLRNNTYDLLHPASADMVSAMVLGMQDQVGPEAYAAVNRAGTVHILAVSGLHMSILAGMVLAVLRRIGVPRRGQPPAVIAVAFAFVLLVGASASIVRAFAMTSLSLLAGMGRRRADPLSALGFAAAVICLVWPQWVLGWGFWLSAGSTLGILLYANRLTLFFYRRLRLGRRLSRRLARAVCGGGAVSLAAYAVTFPLLAAKSGWISLASPVANILVAPFVPAAIAGGILCAAVGDASLLMRAPARLTEICTAAILKISQGVAALPGATASIDEPWMLLWLGLFAATAVVLVRRRMDRRLLAYAAALLVCSYSAGSLTHRMSAVDAAELAIIENCDTAVLLRDDEAVILGTPAYYEAGRLLRYLEFRGVRSIRAVMAYDCGEQVGSGLLQLSARYPVECVVGPNDAYILSQLAEALPEVPVYSGGYAMLTVLGGLHITATVPDNDLVVYATDNTIIKTSASYAAGSAVPDAYTIRIHPDNQLALHGARGIVPSPMGRMLFGETRIVLEM